MSLCGKADADMKRRLRGGETHGLEFYLRTIEDSCVGVDFPTYDFRWGEIEP